MIVRSFPKGFDWIGGGVPLLLELLLQFLEFQLVFLEKFGGVVFLHELVDIPNDALHPTTPLSAASLPLALLEVILEADITPPPRNLIDSLLEPPYLPLNSLIPLLLSPLALLREQAHLLPYT